MDIALAIEHIQYAAQYDGSVTANTESAWSAVRWTDPRIPKPTWAELQAAWTELTAQEAAAQRLAAIDARLTELDTASVRPLRALVDGSATEADRDRLAAIEQEAETLRAERKTLEA